MESLLRLAGLAWSLPDFSTLSRRQETLTVDISYRGSDDRLHLLIDSTGANMAARSVGPGINSISGSTKGQYKSGS
ncbi:transposase [Gluconobacter cadivus]|uniref:transposase n=1 Tax=Gluconobacter cadivus TaxID=2728101 RepID=UPI0038D24012